MVHQKPFCKVGMLDRRLVYDRSHSGPLQRSSFASPKARDFGPAPPPGARTSADVVAHGCSITIEDFWRARGQHPGYRERTRGQIASHHRKMKKMASTLMPAKTAPQTLSEALRIIAWQIDVAWTARDGRRLRGRGEGVPALRLWPTGGGLLAEDEQYGC